LHAIVFCQIVVLRDLGWKLSAVFTGRFLRLLGAVQLLLLMLIMMMMMVMVMVV